MDDKICHINELGINGEVPIYYAPNKEVCQFLLDRGADVNAQGGEYGDALRAAIAANHKEVVRLLSGSGVNVNAQGGKYGAALSVATLFFDGNHEIVELLLDRGADVNDPYLLVEAVGMWSDELVLLLIDRGADVNAEGQYDGHPMNALGLAVRLGRSSTVKLC